MRIFLQTLILALFLCFSEESLANAGGWDSLAVFRMDTLSELQITGYRDRVMIPVPETLDMILISSKKTSLIKLDEINANLVQNSARQVFSRTPGVFVFESDGSGAQMGVSVRGLSPNRSWEFNVRQNGYDIAADPFGYPEAYYSPSLEAVEQVQLIRGAATLQFGPQFGGLLNYSMKSGDKKKRIAVESLQSIGSYGLLNTYNSVGGQLSSWNYFVSYHHRQADGWRENARYRTGQLFGRIAYQLNTRLEVALEATMLRNELQQPGGLTDSLFAIDPSQSLRARNWLSTPWNTIHLLVDWKYSDRLRLKYSATLLAAERNSVGMVGSMLIQDTVSSVTGSYANRQVDRDYYKNFTSEIRVNYEYSLSGRNHTLVGGVRCFTGTINRNQKGVGTNSSFMDFELLSVATDFPRKLEYGSLNYAAFTENVFHLTSSISVTPGLRFEYIRSSRDGRLGMTSNVPEQIQAEAMTRSFLLAGIGAEWKYADQSKLYFNFSQSYRPVTYSELTPAATMDIINPSLKDASGFSADFGTKGKLGDWLSYDVNLFYLRYRDRVGNVTLQRDDLTLYQYKTNLGDSRHRGVEMYLEAHPFRLKCPESFLCGLGFWASVAITSAEYVDYTFVNTTSDEANFINLSGNQVEYAPRKIVRYGLTWASDNIAATLQESYTSSVFTDANNTVEATDNAQSGQLPAYSVVDFSGQYTLKAHYIFKLAINNLLNDVYATRRSAGYPGPGLLPNEGRTVVFTVGIRF